MVIPDPVSHALNHDKRESHKVVMDSYHNRMYGEIIDNGEIADDDDDDDDDEMFFQDDSQETGVVAPNEPPRR